MPGDGGGTRRSALSHQHANRSGAAGALATTPRRADTLAKIPGEGADAFRAPGGVVTRALPLVMNASTGVEGGGIYARQVARGYCVLGGGQGFADWTAPAPGPVKTR